MGNLINETLATLANTADAEQRADILLSFGKDASKLAGNVKRLLGMLKQLIRRYPKLSQGNKISAILMSTFLYELIPLGEGAAAATSCAQLDQHILRTKGYTWSEIIFYHLQSKKSTGPHWDRQFAPHVSSATFRSAGAEAELQFIAEATCCFEISRTDRIVCYREEDGTLVLLMQELADKQIYCDEECFKKEAPLYFTDESHFISPVYKLQKARDILAEILSEIGYPYLRIKLKVMYTSSAASLMNEEDMWEYWKGLDLENLMPRNKYFIADFVEKPTNAFPEMLQKAIAGTSLVYASMNSKEVYNLKKIQEGIQEQHIFLE